MERTYAILDFKGAYKVGGQIGSGELAVVRKV